MKKFLDENFLLGTDAARQLYHEYAKEMPVIDYHCHLSSREIAADHRFDNLTQAWLYGDHYKWRAMRTNGVEEGYCTGEKLTGKNSKVGGDGALYVAKPLVSLDASGIAAVFRDR